MNVSLVIPAHNEQARLASTLDLYVRALYRSFGESFEVIVVANGCSDRTAEVARNWDPTSGKVVVVDIPEAIGKGGAVIEGFQQAKGERVIFADADAATRPESLIELLEHLDHHDVVIGSRRLPNSVITGKQPLLRRLFGHAFVTVVRLSFGLPFQDTQCGAKAFRTQAAKELSLVVTERRWVFDVDLLLAARAMGFDIIEHPVVWHDQAGSQLRIIPTIREVMSSILRLRRRWADPNKVLSSSLTLKESSQWR